MSEHPPIPGYELLQLRRRNSHLTYLARQVSSGCWVHLNVVHSGGGFGEMVADRLRQQAALLATLYHPNILRALEVGNARGCFFSALEYAEGGCLADKLRTGPLPSTEAALIARAIASAVQYARRRSVIQDDLSPNTVLLAGDNVPKLADFRPIGSGHRNALTGKEFTPSYAAPEELSDSDDMESAPTADVYRVGGVLYAMLTGQAPFPWARVQHVTIQQMLEHSATPVRQRNPAVPADLEAICMKCLDKQPASRYSDSRNLVDVLDKFLAGRQPEYEPGAASRLATRMMVLGVQRSFPANDPAPEIGIKTRRIIEMVGTLHRLGYGRLRLECFWENAGPAPVWFGTIAPASYFRRDHGALLARDPLPENQKLARQSSNPNDAPMFTSRRFKRVNYPWPGFLEATLEQLAEKWLSLYPQLAVEGRGEDADYVAWYVRMLEQTAPTGVIASACYWEPLPGYIYVSCGPAGVDRVPLPPPGYSAANGEGLVDDELPGTSGDPAGADA